MLRFSEKSFRWKNGKLLMDYMMSLVETAGKARQSARKSLELFVQTESSTVEINGKKFTAAEFLKIYYIMTQNEPGSYIYNWNFLIEGRDGDIIYVFKRVERYIKCIPGTKLPYKDPKLRCWMWRVEKKHKKNNDTK